MNSNPNDRRTTLVQQQAGEIQQLRKQLADLKGGKLPAEPSAAPASPGGPVVEKKALDPRALLALRDLLVACENLFGPPDPLLKAPKELAEAMKAAAVFVRKEKKP